MLDIDSGKLEIMETPEDLSFDNPTWTKYLEVMEQDDMIIIPNRTANYVTVMDKETSNIRWIKPKKIKCDEGLEYIRWHNHSLEIEDDLELLMCYLKKMI